MIGGTFRKTLAGVVGGFVEKTSFAMENRELEYRWGK